MVQRVGLAQALVNDPELVILDEPMSGLDPVGRRDVRDLIIKLRDEGRTILFSSHILSDAELLCSSVGILAKGKLVASGTLTELTAGGARGLGGRRERRARRARGATVASRVEGRRASATGATPSSCRSTAVRSRSSPSCRLPAVSLVSVTRPPDDARRRLHGACPMTARRIGLVAWHVFKESVRDRVLYGIGAFALLLVAGAIAIGQLTAAQPYGVLPPARDAPKLARRA